MSGSNVKSTRCGGEEQRDSIQAAVKLDELGWIKRGLDQNFEGLDEFMKVQ